METQIYILMFNAHLFVNLGNLTARAMEHGKPSMTEVQWHHVSSSDMAQDQPLH